jgi:putative endonuclease
MIMQRGGCVYIITNLTHSVLYTGVTSNIIGRIWDHKNKIYPKSFTAKYNCNQLVYYFFHAHIEEAIAAEKILKAGSRESKIDLINKFNPDWKDLYDSLINDNN